MTNERIRGRPRRPWVKLHTSFLDSSINYEMPPEHQLIFVKLIALAACCGDSGVIADNDGKPMPHEFIAHRLFVSIELFEAALEKCISTMRVSENGSGIQITNWEFYQGEYARQKKYRESQKAPDPGRFVSGRYGKNVKR